MEHDRITNSTNQVTFLLKVDTDSIGYFLESDDEIIGTRKIQY